MTCEPRIEIVDARAVAVAAVRGDGSPSTVYGGPVAGLVADLDGDLLEVEHLRVVARLAPARMVSDVLAWTPTTPRPVVRS